ncbi:MAG: SIMPL domain-containing protein [Bacterioplanes sp.]|nr:SIMPL domain-containing protein [Bacterioplanes sp.]
MRRLPFLILIFLSVFAHSALAQRVVEVQGQGTVEALPDYVELTLLISNVQPEREQAKNLVDHSMQQLLALTEQFAIAKEDIDAAQIRSQPHYQWQQGERIHRGEQVARDIRLTLRTLADFTAFSHALILIPDLQLQRTELRFNDPDALYQNALALAARQAQQKAERLASTLNNRLGHVLSITEQGGQHYGLREARVMSMADSPNAAPAPMLIQAQAIEASVSIRYQLRQP